MDSIMETRVASYHHRPGRGTCRFCGATLEHTFVDLGPSPLCESFLTAEQLNDMEAFYPLHVYVCQQCFLVQLEEFVSPEHIFTEYAYFSSYADTWLGHCRAYVDMITDRLQLNEQSSVVEVGSNDGYLLQYFRAKSVPVLGIEPAKNVATAAVAKGVATLTEFFGTNTARRLAAEGRQADLLLGNNVMAQVPDLNDFVSGLKILLKPHGVITIEFPHLMQLVTQKQFDTIYHEHFSYFGFVTTEQIFAAHGLSVFDVEELATHGGSLRIYAHHREDSSRTVSERVTQLRAREQEAGVCNLSYYTAFGEHVKAIKRDLLDLLIQAKRAGKSVAGYGAPGKGNTLLNYCGIRTDFLEFTVDRNPYKHGKYLPGSHIPIFAPESLRKRRPDYVLILPWNLRDEILQQVSYIHEWGGQFIVPIPEVRLYPPIPS